MTLTKVAIWAALPLTIIGLLVSFLIAVAGAGHGDKSAILFIFPLPAFVWVYGGFVLGVVAAGLQFPLYALADISFYCDNINETVRELQSRGVEFTQEVEDHGYGFVTHFKVPGGFKVQLYEPKYAK